MKIIKLILFCLFLGSYSIAFSQLKVNSYSNVIIHNETESADDRDAKLSIRKTSRSTSSSNLYGAVIKTDVIGGYWHYGLYGQANRTTASSSGRAFGVFGTAGNASSGYNYGVLGTLGGDNNGAGVYGTIGASKGESVPGKYAGYFRGNVGVTGTISGTLISSSDIRLKENVVELKSQKALTNILKMNPIEYNYKQTYAETQSSDTALVKTTLFDASVAIEKKQFGLSAQELQDIYPDLVYEQDNGYLAINYTGLIPILIQSVKELKEEVDNLKEENRSIIQKAGATTDINTMIESQIAVLYQNAPNPFSTSTQIKYYLPIDAQSANLFIYDMQGKQLKQYNISQKGEGSLEISGDELNAGMYLYALVVDGMEVDVKRMILTD